MLRIGSVDRGHRLVREVDAGGLVHAAFGIRVAGRAGGNVDL